MPAPVPFLPGYLFDTRMAGGGRYRLLRADGKPGRLVKEQAIVDSLGQMHIETAARWGRMARAVVEHEISPAVFQRTMMLQLKDTHGAAAALGRGGWGRMDRSLWGKVGAQMRYEYRHLADFARLLQAGELTGDEAEERARLYADNAYAAYWAGTDRRKAAGGLSQERMVLQPDACEPCRSLRAMGWVPIGTFSVPVHLKCRCGKEYR